MPEKIRFALVGAGGIAGSYAAAFADHPDAELVGVADVRLGAAEAMAAKFPGAAAFDRYQALIEGPDFDAVIISTPPNTHERIATHFLGLGKHVLCEKPFTVGGDSARRMAAAAAKAGRVLTMASKFRYTSDVTRAKELIDAGTIGEIILFENCFTARVDMANRWNADPAVSGGGVLIDNGAHSFDLTRYFLGDLVDLHAVEGRRVQDIPVEDTVQIFIHNRAGAMGTVDLSWSINKEKESFLDIQGEKGTIRVGWKESKYRLAGAKEWVVFGSGYDKVQAFRAKIGNFARHLSSGEPLVITVADAVANVDAIDAAYRSLRQVAWTPVTA